MNIRPFNLRQTAILITGILLTLGIFYLTATLIRTYERGKVADYLERAYTAYQNEEYGLAYDLYKKAAQVDQSSSRAYVGLGDVAYTQNAYEEALAFYRQADSQNPEVLTKIAQTLLQLPHPSLSQNLQLLDDALTKDPQIAEAKFLRTVIVAAQMDLEQAIKEISVTEQDLSDRPVLANSSKQSQLNQEKLADLKQRLSTAYQQENQIYQKALVAHILLEQNFPQLALPLLLDILDQQENYRDARLLLGGTYLKIGKYQKAVEELAKASKLDPNFSKTFELLGQTYEVLGNQEKARENFERAQKLQG